jgi:nicotinamidase-related amidase/type 1 glutamine amidotransferase
MASEARPYVCAQRVLRDSGPGAGLSAAMRMLVLLLSLAISAAGLPAGEAFQFPSRTRLATPSGTEVRVTPQQWDPAKTALIVCDFWDSHHCANAVKRVNEMAPRMAEVVNTARERGVLIIHAPSDCMKTYENHPARKRAQEAPAAANLPPKITDWLHWKDATEEKTGYPIDASDGGSDDTAEEDATWKEELKRQGRNPGNPWKAQHPAVSIDAGRDLISDKGVEIWNALEARGISRVLFAGVHTNMCVCGRPFGLRQLSRNGKNVILLRDLTDTMYNPAKKPYVSHYRGTELMIAHVERLICPTALSSEVLGGAAHTFGADKRPHLAVMIGEDEYQTWETLPAFIEQQIGRHFRVSYLVAPKETPAAFCGMEALKTANALLVSVRRRVPPAAQMEALQAFVARGGAVVGIRTASHAFAPRGGEKAEAGHTAWPEWDEKVLGGHYQNHLGNQLKTFAKVSAGVAHPVLSGLAREEWPTGGSLYKNTPLRGGTALLTGRAETVEKTEPVAWTHQSSGGGRVFYTSLGAPEDFARAEFQLLLRNALHWSLGREIPADGVKMD